MLENEEDDEQDEVEDEDDNANATQGADKDEEENGSPKRRRTDRELSLPELDLEEDAYAKAFESSDNNARGLTLEDHNSDMGGEEEEDDDDAGTLEDEDEGVFGGGEANGVCSYLIHSYYDL